MQDFKPSFYIIPRVVQERCNPAEAIVYATIYWFCNLKDGRCTASNTTIQNASGISGVGNALNTLEKLCFIRRIYEDQEKKIRSEIIPLVDFRVSPVDDTGITHRVDRVSPVDEQRENINKNKERKASARKLASAVPGVVLGDQYEPDHRPPKKAKRKMTQTQRRAFDELRVLDPFIAYYREQVKKLHHLSFLHRPEYLNKKIRSQFQNGLDIFGEELYQVIDWILGQEDPWHGYDPGKVMTASTFQEYENRDLAKKKKPSKQRVISFAKKGGDEE